MLARGLAIIAPINSHRVPLRGWLKGTRLGCALLHAGVFSAFVAGQRTEHEVDAFAHELGREIRVAVGSDFFDELLDLAKSNLLMRHLAAAKAQGHLYFHLLAKEIDG